MTPRSTRMRTGLALATALGLLLVAAPAHAASPSDVPVVVEIPNGTREVVVRDAAITSPDRATGIRAGDTLVGYWAGVSPQGTWTVWLMPGDVPLGGTAVGASGRASFSVALPTDLPGGEYWLEIAQPIGSSSATERSASQWLVRPALPFTVLPTPAAVPPQSAPVAAVPPAPPAPPVGSQGASNSGGSSTGGAGSAGTTPGVALAPATDAVPTAAVAPDSSVFVSGLTARYDGSPNPFLGTTTVDLTIRNGGTIDLSGTVTAWVTNAFGATVGSAQEVRLTGLAPDASQKLAVPVYDVGQQGMLTAHATITPDVPANVSEEQKAQLVAVTREAVFWALPLLPIGLGALLIGGVAASILVLRRRPSVMPLPQGVPA